MGLDYLVFLICESAGLVKYIIGNTYLAYIMQWCASHDVRHELGRYLLGIVALLFQTFHDYLNISSGFLYMCTCIGVSVFHQVCHRDDKTVLHLGCILGESAYASHLFGLVQCHVAYSVVKAFHLIARVYIYRTQVLDGTVKLFLICACTDEVLNARNDIVDGVDHVYARHPKGISQHQQVEACKYKQHMDKEIAHVICHVFERHISARISDANSVIILYGLIDCKHPPGDIVAFDGSYLIARKQCGQIRFKGFFKLNPFAVFIGGCIFGVKIKRNVAAVLTYLYDIQILNTCGIITYLI